MYGCELRATRPMADPSMGVSRQPSTVSPSSARDALQDALALQPLLASPPAGNHAHAVFARRRQREAELGALAREELVRDLDQHAGAVAGFRVAAAGAAVRQIDQTWMPLTIMSCDFWPLMLATKPMPHASCSLAGS